MKHVCHAVVYSNWQLLELLIFSEMEFNPIPLMSKTRIHFKANLSLEL